MIVSSMDQKSGKCKSPRHTQFARIQRFDPYAKRKMRVKGQETTKCQKPTPRRKQQHSPPVPSTSSMEHSQALNRMTSNDATRKTQFRSSSLITPRQDALESTQPSPPKYRLKNQTRYCKRQKDKGQVHEQKTPTSTPTSASKPSVYPLPKLQLMQNKPKQKCVFNETPQAVFVHVLSFLHHQKLSSDVVVVCRTWNELIRTKHVWNTSTNDSNLKEPSEMFQGILSPCYPLRNARSNTICLEITDAPPKSFATFKALEKVLFERSCWQRVEIKMVRNVHHYTHLIERMMSQQQNLKVHDLCIRWNQSPFPFVQSWLAIQKLQVRRLFLNEINGWPSLQTLSLALVDVVELCAKPDELAPDQDIWMLFPNLKKLDLCRNFSTGRDRVHFSSLPQHLTHLELDLDLTKPIHLPHQLTHLTFKKHALYMSDLEALGALVNLENLHMSVFCIPQEVLFEFDSLKQLTFMVEIHSISRLDPLVILNAPRLCKLVTNFCNEQWMGLEKCCISEMQLHCSHDGFGIHDPVHFIKHAKHLQYLFLGKFSKACAELWNRTEIGLVPNLRRVQWVGSGFHSINDLHIVPCLFGSDQAVRVEKDCSIQTTIATLKYNHVCVL